MMYLNMTDANIIDSTRAIGKRSLRRCDALRHPIDVCGRWRQLDGGVLKLPEAVDVGWVLTRWWSGGHGGYVGLHA